MVLRHHHIPQLGRVSIGLVADGSNRLLLEVQAVEGISPWL